MTTTHEMDCSDGARMLIERMQTHPEDFNYGGKLYHSFESKKVSARDDKALRAAHDLYILEPRLMAQVLEALLTQPEKEEENMKFKAQGRYAMGMGVTDTRTMYGAPVKNEGKPVFDPITDSYTLANQQRITREMYEDHIQTHKDILSRQTKAVAAEKESIAAQIYNKAFGRERIERDN